MEERENIKKSDFFGRDFISIGDFSFSEINFVLDCAKNVKENFRDYRDKMRYKVMAPLFFESSTRTDLSFQAAMIHMSGRFIDFDVETSSVKKGETLRDTVKIIERYRPDIMVVRHNLDGSGTLVAENVEVPVINAGDGKNQHPTQTLLDIYTIKEIMGEVDNTKIAIAGDLKYGRTVHSLSNALSQYKNCEIEFISPSSLKMPIDLIRKLKQKKVKVSQYGLEKLEDLCGCDILYMTRVQEERFPQTSEGKEIYEKVCEQYRLKPSMLENVSKDFKIMHPLPKVNEIETEIDKMPQAYYFNQVENGLYIRMALLDLILGGQDDR